MLFIAFFVADIDFSPCLRYSKASRFYKGAFPVPKGYSFELLQERLTCNLSRSTQTFTPDFHLHNYYEIYLLTEGAVTFLIEDRQWRIACGDIVLLNDREVHKSLNPGGQPYSRYVVHFDPALLAAFGGEGTENLLLSRFDRSTGAPAVLHLEAAAYTAVVAACRNMEEAIPEATAEGFIRAQAHLALLLCALSSGREPVQEPHSHSFSARVMEYLQAHPTEPFRLDHLAQVFRVDKHYLCRRFRQETGGTVYHYLQLKRIALAQGLLMQGESVSAVGEAAGFADYANFIRTFKKQTGMSPGQYGKRFRA